MHGVRIHIFLILCNATYWSDMNDHLAIHGDGVKDIALQVEGIEDITKVGGASEWAELTSG